ncbi:hypothetical protein B0H13DRAFT_1905641 [Mycena leptocephala]|nr:hypothetical protein B0H13DRAFT_1905641 [Mycena leptocephala]
MSTSRLLRTTIATPRWGARSWSTAAHRHLVQRIPDDRERPSTIMSIDAAGGVKALGSRCSVSGLRGSSSRAYCGDSTKARTHGVYMRVCTCESTCISSFNANAQGIAHPALYHTRSSFVASLRRRSPMAPPTSCVLRLQRYDATRTALRTSCEISSASCSLSGNARTPPSTTSQAETKQSLVSCHPRMGRRHSSSVAHKMPPPHQARQGVVHPANDACASQRALRFASCVPENITTRQGLDPTPTRPAN